VFIVAYQKNLPLLYYDKLLDEIQQRFRDLFGSELGMFAATGSLAGSGGGHEVLKAFDHVFTSTWKAVEDQAKDKDRGMKAFEESDKSKKTIESLKIEPAGVVKEHQMKAQSSAETNGKINNNCEDIDEATRQAKLQVMARKKMSPYMQKSKGVKSPKAADAKKKPQKQSTIWGPFASLHGKGATGREAAELERTKPVPDGHDGAEGESKSAAASAPEAADQFLPDSSVIGNSAGIQEILAETSDEDDDDAAPWTAAASSGSGSGPGNGRGGGIWSSLSSLVGSKSLSREDIDPVISKMQDHIIGKNVATDVAVKLCESVANSLDGKVMGTFQSIHRAIKDALTESLFRILTPKRRIDIIRDVLEAKKNKRPFVMTFCGVNGVGKSTNLAKICFWLLENDCSVLIGACDTFRAGAVEQLRTHQRRLNSFHPTSEGQKPMVQLHERGYGKDPAGIATEAINHARKEGIDVVLVDTAGRMQDNEPLMRALAKLITVNDPDLVLFVGEALVGNEAVDQLVKFNKALADHSSQANPHLIDGIVLTKFDTIDDKVGSTISMTYITGQPIVFVGTGQTYTDLKSLNVKAVVQALMK
jgi:signal recognition particle receptor subunit alpha